MSKRISKFQTRRPTYICHMCKNETRETGEGESVVDLCKKCFIQAQTQNEHYDYGLDYPERHNTEEYHCDDCKKYGSCRFTEHDKTNCPNCERIPEMVGKFWYQ